MLQGEHAVLALGAFLLRHVVKSANLDIHDDFPLVERTALQISQLLLARNQLLFDICGRHVTEFIK